jgi:hypothetical protein
MLALAPFVWAQDNASTASPGPEDLRFDVRNTHPAETERYQALSIGDWGVSFNAFYAMHSYNVTDIRGLDNSLASNWLYAMDPWGLGFRAHIEHRLNEEWSLSIIPRVSVAAGIYNTSYHNTFDFPNLPFTSNIRSANDSFKISIDADIEFAARWRWLWFVGKLNTWSVFRRRYVNANDKVFRDPQLGVLDDVRNPEKIVNEQALIVGGATGVAFDFFTLNGSTPLVFYIMWLPWNYIDFRGAGGFSNGFELILRSSDFHLTNESGLYFEVGFQAIMQIEREVNDVYFATIGLGIRWR